MIIFHYEPFFQVWNKDVPLVLQFEQEWYERIVLYFFLQNKHISETIYHIIA